MMPSPQTVFQFVDYKRFLAPRFASSGETRGQRSRLAQTLGCNPGFVSQVLAGDSHFSLEHAAQVAEFLELKKDERAYFLALVHHAKAGSVKLQAYYTEQLDELRKKNAEVKSRVERTRNLEEKDFLTYYGNAAYALIHMALSIPKFQSPESLVRAFGLPRSLIRSIVQFLLERGLVVQEGGKYRTGPSRIHLDRGSPMLSQHHLNWRMEAVKSVLAPLPVDLHYSAALTMSRKDADRIRETLLNCLQDVESILAPSANEEIFALNLDFFPLERTQTVLR